MLRSKQQALMFLLGAVLVGGVVGASANRVVENYHQKQDQDIRIDRQSFFDDLGFTADQRAKWEAITDTTNCRVLLVSLPYRPAMDSVRDRSWEQLQAVLTPEQRKKFKDRHDADSVSRAARLAARGGRDGGRGDGGVGRGNRGPTNRVTPEYCNAMFKEPIKP